ncbi:MAG: methyltransferase domain-containing protein [Myxococcota bacterium]
MRATRVSLVGFVLFGLLGCQNVSKLEFSRLGSRAAWQHPERVVDVLALEPGQTVADLGAGEGYFLPYLSNAVGANGKVYAVEVDAELVQELERFVADAGLENVQVVRGEFEDPMLPDGAIDVLFTVNTFHHIEDQAPYFARLRERDLRPSGRVAILEPNQDLGGVLSLFQNAGHWSRSADVVDALQAAGFQHTTSHDFLPVQIFEVFAPLENPADARTERAQSRE